MELLSVCEEQVLMTVYMLGEAASLQSIMTNANQMYKHAWKPQTISTFLSRCVKKGYLTMQREGRSVYYNPVISLQRYQMKQLLRMKDVLFQGDIEKMKRSLGDIKE